MIFDGVEVLNLLESRNNGNVELDSNIHEETRPLIESIAASLCSGSYGRLDFNDLVQEGHLKLQNLIMLKSYKLSRGTIYSFFSFVLKNAMIDFIRKNTKEVLLSDREGYIIPTVVTAVHDDSNMDHVSIDTLCDLSDYALYRFPSVSDYLALLDAFMYVAMALHESVRGKFRGIQKTLPVMYGFSYEFSKILCRSALIFLKLCALDSLNYPNSPKKFIFDNPSYEISNVPDIALLVGHEDMNLLLSILDDMKIVL